ncbi:MAG: ECF transporter S component [Syntrophobacteraceae bacterium]
MSLHAKHYFGTKDLVTIAGVACMGGVASTYMGYIGHLLGAATGIPVLSQVTVGLHVLWLVLILALLNKKGSGLLCALVDNLIQFLMGSHIGILVLPIGILQGILAEVGFWTARRLGLMPAMLLAGGLSSIAHILFFQTAFHQFGPLAIALGMGVVAFVAGAFLGGLFPYSVAVVLQRTAVAKVSGIAPAFEKRQAAK